MHCHRIHRIHLSPYSLSPYSATTFSEVERGAPFWYENSSGLVEIAVNQGRASDRLGLAVGDAVALDP